MKILRKLALVFVILLLLAGGFAFWLYRELRAPFAHERAAEYIEVPRGSSTDEIVSRVASAGVIRRAWPLRLYVRLTGAGPRLKAGEYRFPSPVSPLGVLRKLEEGEERLSRFTVIEGWTRWDIAEAMARLPELQISNEAALALLNDPTPIRDIDPSAENLEGYLYPDTYSFPPNTTAPKVVAAMVQRFRQLWKERFEQDALSKNRSPREVLTVASLVETEAKLADERSLVASVIYNRLRLGIPLGVDSTVIYAAKLAGKWRNDGKIYQSQLDLNSPYNTRKVAGLPPGPVASPGARSIEAALNPAQSDYLFYVREPSRNDGAHNFYNNESDFQRGVQALREWERQRDAKQ
ncbi:MAG TPA: endolytic transglycosylase MltG [Pyrinomonadaceae bacterium]|nr:endolytic transglycosylase MltG [Pyrinomonadaceae bacterium]